MRGKMRHGTLNNLEQVISTGFATFQYASYNILSHTLLTIGTVRKERKTEGIGILLYRRSEHDGTIIKARDQQNCLGVVLSSMTLQGLTASCER